MTQLVVDGVVVDVEDVVAVEGVELVAGVVGMTNPPGSTVSPSP